MDEAVLFAGYAHYHPLNNAIELRVQTKPDTLSPGEALRAAIASLRDQSLHIGEVFNAEFERFESEQRAATGAAYK
jgi:DNA-directed RNA polymerase subunit L